MFFLPKTTDTTITELCIENMVRPSVFATAIVPLEDMKKYSGTKGAGKFYEVQVLGFNLYASEVLGSRRVWGSGCRFLSLDWSHR